jgi:hypothetical protein
MAGIIVAEIFCDGLFLSCQDSAHDPISLYHTYVREEKSGCGQLIPVE